MKAVFLLASLVAAACAQPVGGVHERSFAPQLQSVEAATGSRLGVALVDQDGRLIAGRRTEERFAFCSTFKLLLGGMILDSASDGKWSLDERLYLTNSDLVFHSPVTEQHVDQGFITVRDAARAIVTISDNAAANLLLRRVGGVQAFNHWLVRRGDQVTRLDRLEPSLNENVPGDVRDTTTPKQIATNASHLLFGDWLPEDEQKLLREWLIASKTGLGRIRAGLPPNMISGDKTGTCGGRGRESYNDIAFILPSADSGRGYVLAVYLDRPSAGAEGANAAIAQVANSAVPIMRR